MIVSKYSSVIALLVIIAGSLFLAGTATAALEFELRSVKESYLVAEPVFIDITLKNTGTTDSPPVSPELAVENQHISMFIARGDGQFERFDPGFHIEPSRGPVALEPRKSIVHRQLVLHNGLTKDFAFPDPGVYRVRAVYHTLTRDPDIESNVIEIRVTRPSGTDAEALRLFATKEVAYLVMNLGEDSKAVADLEVLTSRYPGTTYGKYAQYYLARRQAEEFLDRKPDYKRAIQLYQGLIRRDARFTLIAEANYQLGIAQMKAGQYDNAKRSFNEAIRQSRVTTLIEKAQRAIKQTEKRQREAGTVRP